MFQQLRSRERAFLGHMPDKEDRRSAGLGHVDQFHAAVAELRHRARRRRQLRLVDHLDRIDDHHVRLVLLRLRRDPIHVGFGQHQQALRPGAQPRSPERRLPRRFLAGDIQNFHRPGRPACSFTPSRRGPLRQGIGHLQQQRGLADPWFASNHHGRTGHYPAPEDTVELVDACANARRIGFGDLADGQSLAHRRLHRRHTLGNGRPSIRGRFLVFLEGIPSAAIRTLPEPLRVNRAAAGTEKLRSKPGHEHSFPPEGEQAHLTPNRRCRV